MPAVRATSACWAVALLAAAVDGARLRLHQHINVKRNVDFNLKLSNHDSVQYSASFSLGEQTLPVIYDTGSFEIIVLSTLCVSCRSKHAIYDSSKSASFMAADGVTAEHLFGSGPVRSEKGFETAYLGGFGSPYKAERMHFWQVIEHDIPVWNEAAHFSGIIGLGYPDHVPQGFSADSKDTLTMLAAMGISTFSICLERGRLAAPGWLAVGPTVDAMRHLSHFQPVSVVGRVHWGVAMTGVRARGLPVDDLCSPACGAIVDSGTSLIAVPPSAQRLVSALSALIKRDCSNIAQLPVLEMELDGRTVQLPPAAYVMQVRSPVWDNSTIWRALVNSGRQEMIHQCLAAFMSIDKMSQHGPVWILGMPFLRYYHTVFDRAAKKVHLAPSTPTCQIANKPAGFFNATHLEGAQGQAVMRSFAAADYQPTEVDLNEARLPGWATSPGRELRL